MAEAEVKTEASTMSIFVKEHQQTIKDPLQFRVKSTTKFEKIITAFATKKALDPQLLRFVFDGHRIERFQTPGDLDMEDGDCVDVFTEQLGGANK
eukprot:CAMPEP_0202913672 /NCGR_PEP_ID=MMETSP1392-20130828/61125_1 /ASSEMBLY_ACC=CAM_ASM_000868 /TAXON_ID=225041 /ORGANISM="Chlamydomonas chlamydogama, Strain SAG 11-48b" /LENGTH=94 /DNA_ID=CAMNT_0049605021 /DNA_START=36 /DNA_END=320 /DNA_ORIENTATION=-